MGKKERRDQERTDSPDGRAQRNGNNGEVDFVVRRQMRRPHPSGRNGGNRKGNERR